MATRHLLVDLAAAFSAANVRPTVDVSVVSMGGVEAASRVAAGEPFDGVVLAGGIGVRFPVALVEHLGHARIERRGGVVIEVDGGCIH